MKRALVLVLSLTSLTSMAKEFVVSIYENGGKEIVRTVELPSNDVIIVDGEESKCLINSFALELGAKYSTLSLEIVDNKGNRASSGGLFKRKSAKTMTLNSNICIVREK